MGNSFLFDHPGLDTGYFQLNLLLSHSHTFYTAATRQATCLTK